MQLLSRLIILAFAFAVISTTAVAQEAPIPDTPFVEPGNATPPSPEPPTRSEPPAEESAAEPVAEPSDDPTEQSDDAEVGADGPAATDEATEPATVEEGTDWAGLMERAPAFIALTHHAAVHMPIALWMLGAFFVLVGAVAPSWRNQIPMACLLGGAATSVVAAASGWWYAAYEWGEDWAWGDGFSLEEHLDKHRWTGVALVVASLVLSIMALISQAKKGKAKKLAILWRLGLLALAAAVAWEGHIGGELIHGEGFLEEAFEVWINGEE